ncbi:hypothetical protein ACA910_006922 [Epithemia clementina (nom. ined.)]
MNPMNRCDTARCCGRRRRNPVLQWRLFLVRFLVITSVQQEPPQAHAKCQVQDKNQRNVLLNLNSNNAVLPTGIHYDAALDVLHCYDPGACHEFRITGCARVDCTNVNACAKTRLIDNDLVRCQYSGACFAMHVERGHDVICNASHSTVIQPCLGAWVELFSSSSSGGGGTLYCLGPGSCVSHHRRENRIQVRVGSQGRIQCENRRSREYACQDMRVEIPHARRACVHGPTIHSGSGGSGSSSSDSQSTTTKPEACALSCINEFDCDVDTEFVVVESEGAK